MIRRESVGPPFVGIRQGNPETSMTFSLIFLALPQPRLVKATGTFLSQASCHSSLTDHFSPKPRIPPMHLLSSSKLSL
jgi:hypothetical protein